MGISLLVMAFFSVAQASPHRPLLSRTMILAANNIGELPELDRGPTGKEHSGLAPAQLPTEGQNPAAPFTGDRSPNGSALELDEASLDFVVQDDGSIKVRSVSPRGGYQGKVKPGDTFPSISDLPEPAPAH